MKLLLKLQALITISISLFAYFIAGWGAATSVFIGCVITVLNIVSMGFMARALLQKKSIALAFVIIVLKYPLLIGLLYRLIKDRRVDTTWLLVGLGTLLITGLLAAFIQQEDQNKNSGTGSSL